MSSTKRKTSVNVFLSSVDADQELCQQLIEHLSALSSQGTITLWHEQHIPAGADRDEQIRAHLDEADLILLLVSASFIASPHSWNIVVKTALQRQEVGLVRVIPILLKPVHWQETPFGHLQALPPRAKPVTQWQDQDAAFEAIVRGIREVVEDLQRASLCVIPPLVGKTPSVVARPARRPRIDWGDAPAFPFFYGRTEEGALLSEWIVQERCRVVSVLGMGGIGKSALSVSLMHQHASHFDVVIFRSLRDASLCEVLLAECLQVLSPQPLRALPASLYQGINLLLEILRKTRALVVLDNLECLLEQGNTRGHFRPGYEGYRQLLHRVAETDHQSCLLFTSREHLSTLRPFEGRTSPVRSLRLAGLDPVACQQLLVEKEVSGSLQEQAALIEAYSGNPLALKIVAETIVDLFGGEIGLFLVEGAVIFDGITDLLDEQFGRLSPLEQSVLSWLAIVREPVTFEEVLALLVTPLPRRQGLLEAVDSLRHRSLIERGKRAGSFTLQSVVLEYVTEALIVESSQEIQQHRLNRFIRHGLSLAHAKEYVRQTQERLLLFPLLADLRSVYQGRGELERQLLTLLDPLRAKANSAQGYGPANLIALLRVLRGNLNGLDLSHLCIRGAYLQSVEMHDTKLSGSLMRETVLTEAANATWAVAISRDGKWWAAGGMQGKARVWDEKGQILHLIQAHTELVQTLAFSPDGRTLASASMDDTVKLWDIGSGALLWTGWQIDPLSLAFSPDSRLLACGGLDAAVRLWDPQSGAHLQTLKHPSHVCAVTWSPDGSLLATGCIGGQMCLWERRKTTTQAEILFLLTSWQTSPVGSLAFAPSGTILASGNWDRICMLWEVPSGRLLQTLPGRTDRTQRIIWSPDGRTLASGSYDNAIWLWDVEQNRYRTVLHGHTANVCGMAFTPDSSRLFTGGEDGTLRIWDVQTGRCIHLIAGYGVSLYDVDWSPDGTHLVSGGTDGMVAIWDLSKETPPSALHDHIWFVCGVGWSPNGKVVASCSWDTTLRLWDATSGTCVQVFQKASAVLAGMAWSPDGNLIACGTLQHGVRVWDMTTGRVRLVEGTDLTIHYVAWSPDGTQLVGGSVDKKVYLWECADGRQLQRLVGHQGGVMGVGWSPDGRLVASCSGNGGNGELFVWDIRSGECVQSFAGHPGMIYALAWSPNGDQLISGGGDGKLRWWDVESGRCVRTRDAHDGTIRSLRVNRDGKRLASCGYDGAIMIWDLESFEHLRTLRRDRPYERLNITGIRGLNEAQRDSLRALGAIEDGAH